MVPRCLVWVASCLVPGEGVGASAGGADERRSRRTSWNDEGSGTNPLSRLAYRPPPSAASALTRGSFRSPVGHHEIDGSEWLAVASGIQIWRLPTRFREEVL